MENFIILTVGSSMILIVFGPGCLFAYEERIRPLLNILILSTGIFMVSSFSAALLYWHIKDIEKEILNSRKHLLNSLQSYKMLKNRMTLFAVSIGLDNGASDVLSTIPKSMSYGVVQSVRTQNYPKSVRDNCQYHYNRYLRVLENFEKYISDPYASSVDIRIVIVDINKFISDIKTPQGLSVSEKNEEILMSLRDILEYILQ